MEIRAVVIKGSFTEADWRDLTRVIRRIEQRHPTETYHLMILDPTTNPIEDAEELLRRTFPRISNEEPFFETRRRK